MDDFDVVIVGARCAGSPLAIMLARRGLRVCLLDKAHFPSETPSTHAIQPCGVQILDDLGVLDAIQAAGAVSLNRFTLVNEDVRIDGGIDPPKFPKPAICVRRVTLDALLVDAAAQAGAEIRTGCRVTGLTHDEGGRVTGVETGQGPVSAHLVVGADGRHSTVAAATGAAEYLATPPGRVFAWAYFDGVADLEGRLRLGRLGDHAFLGGPTDGSLYAVDHPDAARYRLGSGSDPAAARCAQSRPAPIRAVHRRPAGQGCGPRAARPARCYGRNPARGRVGT